MYSSDNEVPTHACTVAWTSLTPLPGEGAPVANVRVGKARWRAAPHRGTNLKRTGTSSGWKRPMSGSIPARVSFPELAIMIVVFCLLWVLLGMRVCVQPASTLCDVWVDPFFFPLPLSFWTVSHAIPPSWTQTRNSTNPKRILPRTWRETLKWCVCAFPFCSCWAYVLADLVTVWCELLPPNSLPSRTPKKLSPPTYYPPGTTGQSKRGSRNAHILEERSGELSGSLDEELR